MPKTVRITIPVLATLVGAFVTLLVLTSRPASARTGCALATHARRVPHLVAPCDGAIVAAHRAITFTAVDAAAQAPYLNLQTSHGLRDGHLPLDRDGNGVFAQMTAVPGRPGVWSDTVSRESYPSWWDNHPGTYLVQLEQVDPRLASGILYGPITTIRVR